MTEKVWILRDNINNVDDYEDRDLSKERAVLCYPYISEMGSSNFPWKKAFIKQEHLTKQQQTEQQSSEDTDTKTQ